MYEFTCHRVMLEPLPVTLVDVNESLLMEYKSADCNRSGETKYTMRNDACAFTLYNLAYSENPKYCYSLGAVIVIVGVVQKL